MDRSSAPTMARGHLLSPSVERTRAIGRALGHAAPPGTVLALTGELGAGKTQLAKGVAEGLGITTVVNSPTFVLMNEHVGRLRMYHVDAYRLTDPEEAAESGLLDEREVTGLTVIEWADRLEGWLPPDRLDIRLEADPVGPDRRRIAWEAHGEDHERLAAAVLAAP
jgi:tRNA threonylcarbamoyladenosine biosynthesis protein TsaE